LGNVKNPNQVITDGGEKKMSVAFPRLLGGIQQRAEAAKRKGKKSKKKTINDWGET